MKHERGPRTAARETQVDRWVATFLLSWRTRALLLSLVERTAAEIEQVLDEHPLAAPNAPALQRVSASCDRLHVRGGEARPIVEDIRARAARYYADGGSAAAANATDLYHEMRYMLLPRLRALASDDAAQVSAQASRAPRLQRRRGAGSKADAVADCRASHRHQ